MTICPLPSLKRGDNYCFNSCAKSDDRAIRAETGHSVSRKSEINANVKMQQKNPVLFKYGVFQDILQPIACVYPCVSDNGSGTYLRVLLYRQVSFYQYKMDERYLKFPP